MLIFNANIKEYEIKDRILFVFFQKNVSWCRRSTSIYEDDVG